jgi:Taurine catabolism dioxygenase TauD, TfdA family
LFCAEIGGAGTGQPMDDETSGEIRAAFEEHSVLVFRDQKLDDAKQIAFSDLTLWKAFKRIAAGASADERPRSSTEPRRRFIACDPLSGWMKTTRRRHANRRCAAADFLPKCWSRGLDHDRLTLIRALAARDYSCSSVTVSC